MILIFIGIGLLILGLGVILSVKIDNMDVGGLAYFISAIILTISIIEFIWVLVVYKNGHVSLEKVELLEEHNVSIENKMDEIVKQYLDYEIDVYGNIEVLLILIPELKGNTIVEKQIEVYIKNSNEIKELKLSSVNIKTYAWWLWFGNE